MLGLPLGVQKIKGTDNSKEENDHSKKISKLVSETDELFTADKMTELLELLKPYEGEHDVEIQWRLARACYKVAILPSTSKEDKKRLAYEALDHIQRALSLNSDNFATQEWAGIIVGFIGDFEGNKEKIKKAYIMRDHFVKAIELNPSNATCRHLLGQWCFGISEMPWYIRQIASAFFATPPTSSYQEALDHFLKAENLEPEFYSTNLLFLGKTYWRLGDKEKAKEWLEKTVAFDGPCAGDVEDIQAKDEARMILKKL
jgi:tetratricopeptide (TPR) repeat protein